MLHQLKSMRFLAAPLMAAVIVSTAAFGNPVKVLNQQVKLLSFQPVNPIVTGIKPGLLYMETKAEGGTTARTILCRDLFSGHQPTIAKAIVSSLTINNTKEAKASLSLLPGLFKTEANAEASLANAGIQKGTLSFGGTEVSGLQALVDADGKPRKMSKDCMEAIAPFFGSNGDATRSIFLVAETLSANEISYNMNIKKNKSAGLQAALKNIIGIGFGYKKTGDTTAVISFKAAKSEDRMIIGVKSIKVRNLKRDTMVSDSVSAFVVGDKEPITETAISLPQQSEE